MKTQLQLKSLILAILFSLSFVGVIYAQTAVLPQKNVTYDLRIMNPRIPNQSNTDAVLKGFTYDLDLEWGLYVIDERGQENKVDSLLRKSAVIWSTQKDFSRSKRVELTGNSYRLKGLKVGRQKYYIKIEGQLEDQMISSDAISVVHGMAAIISKWPIPMFFPVNMLLHNDVFDSSTELGKFAFTVIWYLFFFGLWIIFKCRTIAFNQIFPLYKTSELSLKAKLFKKNYQFEASLAPKFRFIIEAWKSIIQTNNDFVNKHLSLLKSNNPKSVQMHRALMKKSADALLVLIKLLENDYEHCDQNTFHNLLEQVKSIFGSKSSFHDFVTDGINISTNGDRISLSWREIEDDFCPNLQKNCPGGQPGCRNLSTYPAAKILLAGLENHLNNIFDWEKASSEVDRAIENRSLVEIAALKEKSSIEQLWNFGAIAPLLGLFGTVTGITSVFQSISLISGLEMEQMIKVLAKGIYEALWTTIFGLIVGIIMMSFYYFFKTRLESLQNRWVAIAVHITEKL